MKNISDFGTLGTVDDAPVFQAALNYAKINNESLIVPAGVFQIGSSLQYITQSNDTFSPGLVLIGEGAEKSVIVNNHGGADIVIGTSTAYKFQRHGELSGLSFTGLGTGIKISSAYHYQLNGLQITGKTNHGIHIPTILGDGDACNNISMDQVRIDNCAMWGIFGEVATGKNELSFLTMRNVFIQNCGTLSSGVGGGMYWRGQQLSLDQVSFVLCSNRGLYIEGGAGVGSDICGRNVTFENNVGIHLQGYGIKNMVFDSIQMYSNDQYKTTYGIKLDAQSSIVENVLIRSGTVRATAGNNPNTAFLVFGNNFSNVKAQNVRWDNYDHPGQTRLVGFTQ